MQRCFMFVGTTSQTADPVSIDTPTASDEAVPKKKKKHRRNR